MINEKLLKRTNRTEAQKEAILELHEQLRVLIDLSHDKDLSESEYKQIGDSVELVEFALQKEWGFGQDSSFHTHWRKLDGCVCDTHDNFERYGIMRIVYGDCKYHA